MPDSKNLDFFLAGVEGFEPPMKVLETCVMPFHYTPIAKLKLSLFLNFFVLYMLSAELTKFLQVKLTFYFFRFKSKIVYSLAACTLKFDVWFSFCCHVFYFILYSELERRIELPTSFLPRMYSATELLQRRLLLI